MRTFLSIMVWLCGAAYADAPGTYGSAKVPRCTMTVSPRGYISYNNCGTPEGFYGGGGKAELEKKLPYQPPAEDPSESYRKEKAALQKQQSEANQKKRDAQSRADTQSRIEQSQKVSDGFSEWIEKQAEERRRVVEEWNARDQQMQALNLSVAHYMVGQGDAMGKAYVAAAESLDKNSSDSKKQTDQAIEETQIAVESLSNALEALTSNLESTSPELTRNEEGEGSKELADQVRSKADVLADEARADGDLETASWLEGVGPLVADIGLGFIPVVGPSKDLVEAVSGKSILTGQEIGTTGRAFAALGVITAGVFPAAQKGINALTKAARHADGAAFDLAEKIARSSSDLRSYGPHDPGPLETEKLREIYVIDTFHAGTYYANKLNAETTLYRVYGGNAGELGPYWTRVRPQGPVQAQLDLALNPSFGNKMTEWVQITVPAGKIIYEGKAASQTIAGGELYGQASQVFIKDQIPENWVKARGVFK